MADTKVTALTELTTLATGDLLYAVDDPSGTPLSRKITMLNAVKAAMGLTNSEEFEIREVLHDETLGSAGSFDVSSIPADYDDLWLFLNARGDVSATEDNVRLYFNNDTTDSNYHESGLYTIDAGSGGFEGADAFIGSIPAASSSTSSFGRIVIHIPLYANTNMLKIAYGQSSALVAAAQIRVYWVAMSWEDGGATAINRIQVRTDNNPTDQFVANSRLRIIGTKTSS